MWIHDNAQPHVSGMTREKLTDLRYVVFAHYRILLISHPSTTIFSSIGTLLLRLITLRIKEEVDTAFKDFLESKQFEFKPTETNKLIDDRNI